MRGSRRAAAALAGALAVAGILTACAPDVSVDIAVPEQVEGELAADTVAALETAVTDAMTASGSSGAIVGVWAPWSGSWVAGLGTQSPSGGADVTTDMVFRAGEVTRAMTCDVLYAMVDDGTVSLDDPVTEWVSGVASLDTVTLGQLCDSTSGIGSYTPQLESDWLQNLDRVWNPLELAAYGTGGSADSEPGAAYVDSDAGYQLLGLALERASGESLSSLIAQYVVDPLDLVGTGLAGSASAAPGQNALDGYRSTRDAEGAWNCTDPRDVTELSASFLWADAGAVTTITDLGRYTQALATDTLVGDDSGRLTDPLQVGSGEATWFTSTGGAEILGSLVGQSGSVPGYMTASYTDPASGMTVSVVLNNSGASDEIVRLLAMELASIASDAPAASGQTAPELGLPWTAEQAAADIQGLAICSAPEE